MLLRLQLNLMWITSIMVLNDNYIVQIMLDADYIQNTTEVPAEGTSIFLLVWIDQCSQGHTLLTYVYQIRIIFRLNASFLFSDSSCSLIDISSKHFCFCFCQFCFPRTRTEQTAHLLIQIASNFWVFFQSAWGKI